MKLRITKQQDELAYYGHGKLLITGEYFVLDGAQALSLPTRFGQSLRIKKLHSSESILYWVSLNSKKQIWLNLVFDTSDFSCINSKQEEAQRLSKILLEARKLNPAFLSDTNDRAIETHLEFPNEWGLGSSSTLIHCVSKLAGVDGYQLLKNTIGGSGYDVACAAHNSAILYQLQNDKPETVAVNWNPSFTPNIYFAYTGKKQLSSEAIKYYKEKLADKTHLVNELTSITKSVLNSNSLQQFEELIDAHETIIGEALKMTKVKEMLFADYWGSVKSLGAWGGDFVMMTNERSQILLKNYLQQKNISTVFSWNELILAAN
ncbi:MAG: GYDIA family GHMP kinase [Bacteroidota bacterium]